MKDDSQRMAAAAHVVEAWRGDYGNRPTVASLGKVEVEALVRAVYDVMLREAMDAYGEGRAAGITIGCAKERRLSRETNGEGTF